jgi:hypothetical protein
MLQKFLKYNVFTNCGIDPRWCKDADILLPTAHYTLVTLNMNDVCMCFLFSVRVDLGTHTCGGYPGTLNYIQQDANTFASWGIDMLKLDGCYASAEIYETGYPNMTKALNATGRPIIFSCSWPAYIKTVSV